MIHIQDDPNQSNLIRWTLQTGANWEDFHQALDNLEQRASEALESFSVIATTTGHMPRGNAITHLRRLTTIVGKYESITRFVIVNHKRNPVGQAFVELALRLFSKHGKLQIVTSEEEALEAIV